MLMKILNYKILFFIMLIMGTMITISSNSWIAMWLGLELNLLSFIPIMIMNKNILTSEASLKYFMVQAMASSIFLISIIFSTINYEFEYLNFFDFSEITFIVMNMKLGSAPLHYWFPSVMEGMSWLNCFILMTWQKIAPFSIISYLNLNFYFSSTFIITSIIIGAVGGLNQLSLRKIMAFSSINHLGWMILSIKMSYSLWLIYFFSYSIMSMTILMIFNYTFSDHFMHLVHKLKSSPGIKLILMINLFSLGGLPPFLGFLPKWLIIQNSCYYDFLFLNLILVSFNLITLFYYIRISLSSILFNSSLPKQNFIIFPLPISMYFLSSISILGLLVYSLITFI
uniref:NADH-ubiquinone oxidoreductase chain 2 n=1 Tax=Dianemobius furumagiensis TaxID=2153487 RepID=A0A6B9VWV6_9ORTH|nr:NADH dehydrogenase subunit 2 [Dianemobius furumagiensis]QHQ73095.1 NADH dehydrogenase subunit 2 [Dianemobius furumagiensis]